MILLVLTLNIGSAFASAADDSYDRIKQRGELVVAVDPTYPPMEFEDRGELVGFDVDFANALARRLGVTATFRAMDWAGITAGLQSGHCDVIISSMNITKQRSAQVAFIDYLEMSQVFVCAPTTRVSTPQDLQGKVVAVQVDTTSFQWLAQLPSAGITVQEVKAFKDAGDAFAALKSRQADVVVTDEPVGMYYSHLDPTLVVTGRAIEPKPIGIAIRKEDQQLQNVVRQATKAMQQDGTLTAISNRWFGEELGQRDVGQLGFWRFSREIVLPRILGGMALTIQLTLVSGCIGVAFGLLLSLIRVSRARLPKAAVAVYIGLFRGTPLLLQILFVFFALPMLVDVRLSAMTSGILALSLNAAAYVAEIFRAAIQSIDRGQMEAARALGMSYGQSMRYVILPQTVKRLIPPLVNELAALSKDTSLVMVLGLHELLYETQRIAAAYLRPWEVYFWAGLGYLVIVLALTVIARLLEKRQEAIES